MKERQVTLIYLAGLIDGEGTIRLHALKKEGWKTMYSACVRLGMTVNEPIELLRDTFGGSTYEEERGKYKKMYRWMAAGNQQVPRILEELIPYLRVKRKQAEIVLDFCRTLRKYNGTRTPDDEYVRRTGYFDRLCELNK